MALAVGMSIPAKANLVSNGNFATGNFSGWTLSGDSSGDYISETSGVYSAALTTNAPDEGYISQTLATTVGQVYLVSFLLAGDGATPNSFSASLGGPSLTNVGDTLPSGTSYSYDFTASSTATSLQFSYSDAPGYFYLTNISVTALTNTPEPSTAVAGIGALMLMVYGWRKRLS